MQLHSYRHIFVRIKIETIYLLILYIAMKNENPALEKYAELMIEKMKEGTFIQLDETVVHFPIQRISAKSDRKIIQ